MCRLMFDNTYYSSDLFFFSSFYIDDTPDLFFSFRRLISSSIHIHRVMKKETGRYPGVESQLDPSPIAAPSLLSPVLQYGKVRV